MANNELARDNRLTESTNLLIRIIHSSPGLRRPLERRFHAVGTSKAFQRREPLMWKCGSLRALEFVLVAVGIVHIRLARFHVSYLETLVDKSDTYVGTGFMRVPQTAGNAQRRERPAGSAQRTTMPEAGGAWIQEFQHEKVKAGEPST